MKNKFRLTEESIVYNDRTLYRIEALRDFSNVKKGEKGGFVESEDNLSQEGNCWIYSDAKVYEGASVYDDVVVSGKAELRGNSCATDSVIITDHAVVSDMAQVHGKCQIRGNAKILEEAFLYIEVLVGGSAVIKGDLSIACNAVFIGDAVVDSKRDYIVFNKWWDDGSFFTWTRSNNMWIDKGFQYTGEELSRKDKHFESIVEYIESILKDNEKKFELVKSTINNSLYQIKALRDFGNVKKGDLGGFVESENNLSQKGNCWIFGNAVVCGAARVYGNAIVRDDASISLNSQVYDDAIVEGNCAVSGNAKIHGEAILRDSTVAGHVEICGKTVLSGFVRLTKGDAKIECQSDVVIFKNWWSSGRHFVWTRSNDKWLVGCFYGSGEELINKAYQDSEISGREYKRVVDYVELYVKPRKP